MIWKIAKWDFLKAILLSYGDTKYYLVVKREFETEIVVNDTKYSVQHRLIDLRHSQETQK